MRSLSFTTTLERDKDGTWWYAHVPSEVRNELRHLGRRGIIPVLAMLGDTTWEATLMPWADGSAQIVVNRNVREREQLELGQTLRLTVRPRDEPS